MPCSNRMRWFDLLLIFFSFPLPLVSLIHNPYRVPLPSLLQSVAIAEANLKIFVYPNPFPNPSCHDILAKGGFEFTFESSFPRFIRSSPFYTSNASEADLFLIEHDLFCSVWKSHFQKPPLSSKSMYELYFAPFFSSSIFTSETFLANGGRDHLFIWLADNGPFCSLEKHVISSLYPEVAAILKNVIFMTYFGMNGTSKYFSFPVNSNPDGKCFRINHDLVIPQYHQYSCQTRPSSFAFTTPSSENITSSVSFDSRTYLSYFRGMIRYDKVCSAGSRVALRVLGRKFQNTTLLGWNTKKIALKDSLLGFAPSGVACWSKRLYEAICSDAIPIIIAREVVEPFERFFDWKNFTTKVDTTDLISPQFLNHLTGLFAHQSIGGRGGYSPSPQALPYYRSLHSVKRWFSWDSSDDFNSWRLITLELFCRASKSSEFPILVGVCNQSSSFIANTTYLMGIPSYERHSSPDLPYSTGIDKFPNQPHNSRMNPTRPYKAGNRVNPTQQNRVYASEGQANSTVRVNPTQQNRVYASEGQANSRVRVNPTQHNVI
jgi:hypothetical protein